MAACLSKSYFDLIVRLTTMQCLMSADMFVKNYNMHSPAVFHSSIIFYWPWYWYWFWSWPIWLIQPQSRSCWVGHGFGLSHANSGIGLNWSHLYLTIGFTTAGPDYMTITPVARKIKQMTQTKKMLVLFILKHSSSLFLMSVPSLKASLYWYGQTSSICTCGLTVTISINCCTASFISFLPGF